MATVLQAGVVQVLDQAAALGLGVAIASSSPRQWIADHLDRIGLRDRFAGHRLLRRRRRGQARPRRLPRSRTPARRGGGRGRRAGGLPRRPAGREGGWPPVHRRAHCDDPPPRFQRGRSRGRLAGRARPQPRSRLAECRRAAPQATWIPRRSSSQRTGACSAASFEHGGDRARDRAPVVEVVDRALQAGPHRPLDGRVVPAHVTEAAVLVDRQHEHLAAHAQLARRAVEGSQRRVLGEAVKPADRVRVGRGACTGRPR